MKSNFINRIAIVLFSSILFFSCSSNLDFDQVDDLVLQPTFVANLAYFTVTADQIVDDGSGFPIPPAVEDFDVFKNKFFNENLIKTEFNFEIENTINRAFEVDLILLDANNAPLETISLNVPTYTGGSNVIKYPAEVFEGERLVRLKKSVKIAFVVHIVPGSGTGTISGNLKLKSGAIVYMKIE